LRFDDPTDSNTARIFAGCTSLTNLIFTTQTIVPREIVTGCTSLTSISLPPSITIIKEKAFKNSAIQHLNLPAGLITIEKEAFQNTPINQLALPPLLEYIGQDAFAGTALGYRPIAPNLKEIDHFLYQGSDIAEITLPATIEVINVNAFADCLSLTNVNFQLATNLTRIKNNAFEGCLALAEINLTPAHQLIAIEAEVFKRCGSLKNITFPTGLQSIGPAVFTGRVISEQAPLIESIHLPPAITEIPEALFYGCTNLQHITTASTITNVHASAFGYTIKLKHFPIEPLTYIGDAAFSSCWALEGISLSSNLTYLGRSAFHGCQKITQAHLPDTLKTIHQYTFSNCTSLQDIRLPSQTDVIEEGAFAYCAFETIQLPETLRYAHPLAFAWNPNLKQIKLPRRIQGIHAGCFRNCINLHFVELPESLARINDFAFDQASSLSAILYNGPPPETGLAPFNETASNLTHYVFAQYYTAFTNAGFHPVAIIDEPFNLPQNAETTPPPQRLTHLADQQKLRFHLPRTDHWTHALECTPSLTNPDWQPLPLPAHTNHHIYFDIPLNTTPCFIRPIATPNLID
jgi:hypothetical protein